MGKKWNVLRYYLVFKYRRFTSAKKLEAYHRRKLARQTAYVTRRSPFYGAYEGKEFTEFPVIDKKIMMDHFNAINTVGIDREEALAFAVESERTRSFNPRLHNITVGLSSGTSYSRGIFLVENREQDKWAGYVLARFLPGSILSICKIAFFMRANSNLYEAVGSKKIQFEFFDIYEDMKGNLERLQSFRADIIVAQPSVLLILAREYEKQELSVSPQKIISIAEVLEQEDEDYLKEVFGLAVIHQVYQCTEGCLATTCKYGTLHLNEDIVYIEKEYLDDRRFVPIITDLERTSQPVIRYRLNDVLVERQASCPCGCVFTPLEKIEGREDDIFIFVGRNGEPVSIFPDFIRRCILFAGNITNYRIVQEQDGNIHVFADISSSMEKIVIDEFRKLAKDRGFVLPMLEFHGYTYDSQRKLKRVESRVKKGLDNEG